MSIKLKRGDVQEIGASATDYSGLNKKNIFILILRRLRRQRKLFEADLGLLRNFKELKKSTQCSNASVPK